MRLAFWVTVASLRIISCNIHSLLLLWTLDLLLRHLFIIMATGHSSPGLDLWPGNSFIAWLDGNDLWFGHHHRQLRQHGTMLLSAFLTAISS